MNLTVNTKIKKLKKFKFQNTNKMTNTRILWKSL